MLVNNTKSKFDHKLINVSLYICEDREYMPETSGRLQERHLTIDLCSMMVHYLLYEVLDPVLEGLGRLLRLRHVRRGDAQRPRRTHQLERVGVHA